MQKRGFLVTVASPSGGGKSTICKELVNLIPDLEYSISYTTRAIRINEVHGKDYFFVSQDDFVEKQNNGFFLESALVHGNYYGTSSLYVEECIAKGKILLLDIDVQGVKQVKDLGYDIITIFILPPNEKVLKDRLISRNTDSMDVIEQRLKNAKNEITHLVTYDYLVINNDLDKAIDEVLSIIKAENCRVKRYLNPIDSFYK